MKKYKIIISSLSFCLFIILGLGIVFAEENPSNLSGIGKNNQISLNVLNIDTDKNSYNSSETITGAFVLENHSGFSVTGLSFQLLIGDDYKEITPEVKSPNNIIDFSPRQGDISVVKGGSVVVPFSYTIPNFVGGDKLAIRINILSQSGHLITWKDGKYFSIKNKVSGVSVKSASILMSNGESFELGEGPTIYKEKDPKNASISILISNTSDSVMTIVPQINIHRQNNIEETQKFTGQSFDLKGNETKNISIPLPTLSYKPGVYIADLVLNDNKGQQLISVIEARYIIGGDIATVQNISVNKEILAKGDVFIVEALLSGIAPDMSDIRKGKLSSNNSKKGLVTIKIFNEKDDLVASVNNPFLFFSNTEIKKELNALVSSLSLRAEVYVYNDSGELLLDYKKNLSVDYDTKSAGVLGNKTSLSRIIIFSFKILFFSLIILLIIYFIVKKKNISRGTLVLLFLLSFISMIPTLSFASGYSFGITITPASPYNLQSFSPGEIFYVSGSAWYTACTNSLSRLSVYVSSSWGETIDLGVIDRGGGRNIRRYGYYPFSDTFIAGPFNAPTVPGTYRLDLVGHNRDTYGNVISAVASIDIVVPGIPVNGSCGVLDGQSFVSGQTSQIGSGGYCSLGTLANGSLTNITNGSRYSWQCLGSDGGTNASCQYTTLGNIPVVVPTTSGSGTGGCPSGTYYCELVEQCVSLEKACNTAISEEYFELNPNIKADKVGPVSLKGLFASPSIGNPGYSCVIDWSDKVFKQYGYLTRCTFTTPTTTIEFSPGSTTAPTSYRIDNVVKDTLLRMSCTEVDGESLDTEEVACRINWNYKEVN